MSDPELYLSLLSGRHRDNAVESRIFHENQSFHKDPEHLHDVLDALAAICVSKEQGDIFFVSLAVDSYGTKLYVSTNGTVPSTVIAHLHHIQSKLKHFKSVLESASSPGSVIDSPDPNIIISQTESRLDIQRTIYEYSYKKVQKRYQKRVPEILKEYEGIMKNLIETGTVVDEDVKLLSNTKILLRQIGSLVNGKTPPQEPFLTRLIVTIAGLSANWKKHMKPTGENDLLTQWDALTGEPNLSSYLGYQNL